MSEYTTHPTPDQADAGAQLQPDQARPDRDTAGRFVNHPGPGRPRRQTEAAYLRILADVIDVDTWREVCEKTVEQARSGNPKAREWIARYVLGNEPMTLTALALRDLAEVSDDDELAGALAMESEAAMSFFNDDKTALRTALAARIDERREAAQREAQARAEADRARRRAEREARKAAQPAGDQAAQP